MEKIVNSRRAATTALIAGIIGAAFTTTAQAQYGGDRDRGDRDRDNRGGERHPSLRKAIDALQDARSDLMRADRDFGGHRRAALGAIDRAIEQLQLALQFDR